MTKCIKIRNLTELKTPGNFTMKLNIIVKMSLLIIPVLFLHCASTAKGFVEPSLDDNMLVIGSVIVEDNGYTDKRTVYKKDIRVAIMGKSANGTEAGYWAKTDENGYFVLADVPRGVYVLKAIQLSVGYGDFVTIDNRLNSPNDTYLISQKANILFNASYFPELSASRIQNLKHTVFTLDVTNRRVMSVRFDNAISLKDYKFHNGETLTTDRVETYFIEKYPESAWRSSLEESGQAN